ncbi:MAG: hypothetical protein QOE66_988, partial [Chloroflexota bacterium]|nr:hypothetical protein [Chloroflexota bacterium]
MIDDLPCRLFSLSLAVGLLCGAAGADAKDEGDPAAVVAIRHPVVPGFERFHADPDSDPVQGGLILLGELNCTSCHDAGKALDGQVLRKQAPILDRVGGRVRPSYLRAFLS